MELHVQKPRINALYAGLLTLVSCTITSICAADDATLIVPKKRGGPACAGAVLSLVAGDGQNKPRIPSGTPTATFDTLVARVADPVCGGVAGATVKWEAQEQDRYHSGFAVSLDRMANRTVTNTTDSDGYAKLSGVRGYYGDEPFKVNVTWNGVSKAFNLRVNGLASTSLQLSALSGDNQIASHSGAWRLTVPPGEKGIAPAQWSEMAHFGPLRIKATNTDGSPAAGMAVSFQGDNAFHTMAFSPQYGYAQADANGIAVLPGFDAFYADGAFTMTVGAIGAHPITLHGTVLAAGWFVKKGNNGTVSCQQYCASPQWAGGVGLCRSAQNQNTQAAAGCGDVPGLLSNAAELTCVCSPATN
jgi:hypothetical protein